MNNNDTPNILDLLKQVKESFSNASICKFTEEQKVKYSKLFNNLSNTNGNSSTSDAIKGKALEEIVAFLLENTGGIFEVYRNIKTNTNEIDHFIRLTPQGKLLSENGLINPLYKNLICECKNYNKKIGVTYIGKFYSLLNSCHFRFGILFSYNGVTGSKWAYGSGLIKKIYMSDVSSNHNYIIIDFNINDFKTINDGGNFLDIIDNKLISLQLDTDFSKYIAKHPAESSLRKNDSSSL